MFTTCFIRALFALGSLFFVTTLAAQVDTGSILGTVRDSTGGVIPRAKVLLTNEETGAVQSIETSESGSYVFTPLRVGTYTIQVEQSGFQRQRRTGIKLDIQQQLAVDFSLTVGEITNTVEVSHVYRELKPLF